MFRNVPACSGMFHVPGFIDGPFLSSQVYEQYVGKYEPKAPSFRVFVPRGVTKN